jgi:hypothetical protein
MSDAVLTYPPIPEVLRKNRTGQAPVTFFLIVLFGLLRFLAGGRTVGDQETNLAVVLLGLGILAGLIMVNRPIALVLIIFDMVDMAGWINPAAWGIPGAFKFKDAEFLLLMAIGTAGLVANPRLRNAKNKAGLSRAMAIFVTVIGIYVMYTMLFHGVSITLRVARPLIVYSLYFVSPYYVRSVRDFEIALRACFLLMILTSLTHISQTVFFPTQTLLPYTPSQELSAGIVRLWGPTQPFNFVGLFLLFGILLQSKRKASFLRIAFGICLLASILTLARSFVGYVVAGLVISIILLSARGNRIRSTARFISIIVVAVAAVVTLLNIVGRADVVTGALSDRYEDVQSQFETQRGTFFVHVDYISYLSNFLEEHSGSMVFGLGFRGFTSDDFGGASIVGWDKTALVSIILSDNGWAGLIAAMGLVGIALVFLVIVQCWRTGLRTLRISEDMLTRSLWSSIMVLFCLTPFVLFFSGWIFDASVSPIVALSLGLASRTQCFEEKGRRGWVAY